LIAAPSLMPQKIARLLEQTLDEEEFAWKDLPSIESIEKVIQDCLDGKITADQAAELLAQCEERLETCAKELADFGGRRTGDGAKSGEQGADDGRFHFSRVRESARRRCGPICRSRDSRVGLDGRGFQWPECSCGSVDARCVRAYDSLPSQTKTMAVGARGKK